MNRLKTCPEPEHLERLLLSGGTEEELDQLAAHLDECEACSKQAGAITQNATLEDDLHWAAQVRERTPVRVDESLTRLNEILPDYELIAEIGRGGMGIVYRAVQPRLNREVAIKVLPALMGVVRSDAKARFRREAELAAGLDHTNIISIHDYGEADGTLFYAMQLIRGRSLRDVLDEIEQTGAEGCVVGDPSDPSGNTTRSPSGAPGAARAYYRRIAQWIVEVADALEYAHERGVIHRDIKPSNLLLTADGKLMISDFGLARPTNAHTLTRSSALLGTCRYMAPEQLDPEGEAIDHRVDVYALGATLYELLAFRPMFVAPDDRQVMHQIASREPAPPHRFVRTVPRELETICMKAVHKDARFRYASAGAFADDLRRWLLDMPIEARRGSPVTRAARFVKRHRVPSALAAASVGLAATAGVLWYKYDGAARATTEARLSEAGQRARVHLHHARTLMDDEAYADAISAMDTAAALDPNNPEATRLKAVALARTGRMEQARAVLDGSIAHDPDDWQARYLLGMLMHTNNARGAAMANIQIRQGDTADTVRRSASIGAQLAHVERLSPGSPEALTLRSTVEPTHARAVELLDEALAIAPAFTDAVVEKASRLGCMGRYADSVALLDSALAAHHAGTRVHGMRGMAFYHLGRWDEAERALTDAIRTDPGNIDWWYDRAVVRSYSGRLAGSIEDATRAIELDPGYAYAYVVRGKAHGALGDRAAAIDDFDLAAELDPGLADIYVERGLIHWLERRYDESLSDANRLIQLEPHQSRGYQRRAQTYLRQHRFEEALADLDTCESLSPRDFATPTVRGGVYFEMQAYAEAARAFEVGAARRPAYFGNYHFQALSLMRDGAYQSAVAPLTTWIAVADNKTLGHLRRGMAYEALGEHALALRDYETAADTGRLGGYAELWAGILLLLEGDREGGEAWLTRCETAASPGSWAATLLATVRGEITPEDLRDRADTPGHATEALYYAGVARLLAGDREGAMRDFDEAVRTGSVDTFETDFARTRIHMLRPAITG